MHAREKHRGISNVKIYIEYLKIYMEKLSTMVRLCVRVHEGFKHKDTLLFLSIKYGFHSNYLLIQTKQIPGSWHCKILKLEDNSS